MEETINLTEQAQKILEIAKEYGVNSNFLFINTFKTYLVQIKILQDLEKAIKKDGTITTKEYVKGRENIYTHPAIREYNNTVNSANRTVTTLMKIIRGSKEENADDENDDPLLKALNGCDADDSE
jgi:tRNA(Phe) wybutosine-synthesizing methylase Tyw3